MVVTENNKIQHQIYTDRLGNARAVLYFLRHSIRISQNNFGGEIKAILFALDTSYVNPLQKHCSIGELKMKYNNKASKTLIETRKLITIMENLKGKKTIYIYMSILDSLLHCVYKILYQTLSPLIKIKSKTEVLKIPTHRQNEGWH